MGRTVAAVRKKGNIPADRMQQAVHQHLNCHFSIRKVAKEFQIPYQTLQRYVCKAKQGDLRRFEPNYSVNKIFTNDQELSLKNYIVDCSDKFYGLTGKECCRIAYQLAKKNNIRMPKSWEDNEIAGKDWLRGFRRRFPDLSIRKPEACSIARATAFNKTNVANFYANLKKVMERHPSFGDGSRIYNLDETSTTTVQRPQKVLAPKNRSVCKVTSAERGVLVTTCCIVNAHGQALPPVMVFPRKKYKPHMLAGAPPGTLGLANPSGWMTGDLFVDVMHHFIKYTSSSKENPSLLIMDNHESHLSIEALDLAKDQGVTILTLHPHTTAKMQPLDVGLHAPFKTFYNAAVDSFLMRNPGKTMTIYNVAECVGSAYLRAMTPINITNAFKKCGIFPYDDKIFTDIDFLPSSVTDRPQVNYQITNKQEDETDVEDNISCSSISILDNQLTVSNKTNLNPESLKTIAYKTVIEATATLKIPEPPIVTSKIAELKIIPRTSNTSAFESPSTSKAHSEIMPKPKFITPEEFRPPLKAEIKKKRNARKAGRSIIATDTPEKEALVAKKKKIVQPKVKKSVKRVKKDLFKKNKRTKKSMTPETSDDEDEPFDCSGSSSGGEGFVNESEDEDEVLNSDFGPLKREPRLNDYVLVSLKSKNVQVYYVAQILESLIDNDEEECDFFVSYLKLKSKDQQKFVEPLEPDTAGVKRTDIKFILPLPKTEGTSRRKSTYKFPIDMSQINLRY